ncbi:hypothetical protein Ancab_009884 [Ancistrocladus abbreviatus]
MCSQGNSHTLSPLLFPSLCLPRASALPLPLPLSRSYFNTKGTRQQQRKSPPLSLSPLLSIPSKFEISRFILFTVMKWEMENEEIEAVLEKIWDIHDKLSDAIHSISRIHFLDSLKTQKNLSEKRKKQRTNNQFPHDSVVESARTNNGFVYVKDFNEDSAVAEAKSLDAIRTALENLEDQLEFYHTVQLQQQAERDAAIARIEQSRILLALRLSEHHGRRYKVIEEAMDFVGEVRDATCFISSKNLSGPSPSAPTEHNKEQRTNSNLFARVLLSGLGCAKNVLKLDTMGGILGNAAIFAISMVAMLHLHQVVSKDNYMAEISRRQDRTLKKVSQLEGSSSSHLDVRSARG